ncbi:MAG: hypothetical protein NUW01_01975 [Gemmatimonadaceae bacterium]|nr:hypothetical protein [Gemmatimonadaceae bacterium]
MSSVFLLSPASTAGKRAAILMNPGAEFELAKRLRNDELTIGEVFSFLSGLYFRGKLAYARKFSATPESIFVVTSNRGLMLRSVRAGKELDYIPVATAVRRGARPPRLEKIPR